MSAASRGARRAAAAVACTSAARAQPPEKGAGAAPTPADVVESLTAAYNAHDADRFARRPSDPGWAGELGAPATSTRGLAALGAQPRRAFAAMARPRAVEGEVVIDRERLDGLPGGPRDDVVVLRAVAGRIVRNWTASAAPRPGG